ncbi:MAG TPA: YtxH domain-containing protein [Anaerolineae bacterium]|nr:YtxH domain-containing protein [Anaerolineae bacterium]
MRKIFAFLAGLLLGILAGGVAALLLAPQSGPELKRRIQDGVQHLVEEGKSAAEARRLELESQLESFKQGRPIVLQAASPQAE